MSMNADETLEKEVAQMTTRPAPARRRGPTEEMISNANRQKTLRRRQLEDLVEARNSGSTYDF
ncbi:hypothetical protein [Amantichitinum ursilacus]|uniref:Uncharacterized protein n=1 Tax=Amantichitinum ursilacus TaxID=857265 RepID=A0A0N0GLB3_9NEIS|nr:hypothetical protein [Amantichitinum ursilacus]KPC49925.1 hypothetical protein WG78_18755 [Amantichitinum ursilacus]